MAGSEDRDPLEDYEAIVFELEQYSDLLAHKQRIVVANKMDLPEAKKHLKRFKRKFDVDIIQVSALEHKGIEGLVAEMVRILKSMPQAV